DILLCGKVLIHRTISASLSLVGAAEFMSQPGVYRPQRIHRYDREPCHIRIVGYWTESAEQSYEVRGETEEHSRNEAANRHALRAHQAGVKQEQDRHLCKAQGSS